MKIVISRVFLFVAVVNFYIANFMDKEGIGKFAINVIEETYKNLDSVSRIKIKQWVLSMPSEGIKQ